jgi:hypothetical protein
VLEKAWEEAKKRKFLSGLLLGGVAAALIVIFLVDFVPDDDPKYESLPPSEFLYVDGPRTLAYLAEMEGGQVEKIRTLTNEIRSVSGGLSASKFNVSASAQHESLAESTLTRTEWSALNLLLKDLYDNHRNGASVHPVPLDRPADLNKIREGWLVRFVTHSLVAPTYLRPYVVAHQSATLGALFPDRLLGHDRAKHERKRARIFVKQIGRDPRITFAVSPQPRRERAVHVKILLPMHYKGLTTERSLLEKGESRYSGGKLVVIGKVIRVFRRRGEKKFCTAKLGGKCKGHHLVYTDLGTREVWRSPLGHAASTLLVRKVSHSCKTRRSGLEIEKLKLGLNRAERRLKKAEVRLAGAKFGVKRKGGKFGQNLERAGRGVREARRRAKEARARFRHRRQPFTGRECLRKNLERQTTLYSPGAVILPIAIYK